jgi:hypothetical protein
MNTLQDIKSIYYVSLMGDEMRGFDQYLRDEWTPIYDGELNFIGYERSSDHASY